MRATLALTLTLLVLPLALGAQDATDNGEAQATKVVLREEAFAVVPEDELVATISYQRREEDAARAQEAVNTWVGEALTLISERGAVQSRTAGYYVYRERDAGLWQASQSIELIGQEADVLLDLVGQLQARDGLLRGLDYRLSAMERRAARDDLVAQAVRRVEARLAQLRDLLDATSYHIDELRFEGAAEPPAAIRALAMEAATGAPPVAEPGEATLRLGLTATATLRR